MQEPLDRPTGDSRHHPLKFGHRAALRENVLRVLQQEGLVLFPVKALPVGVECFSPLVA
jgi:hypothetical protein